MSRLQQMKTLLNDVKANRHRIFAVLVGINNAMVDGDDIEEVLKRLAQEGLVSEDQFLQLKNLIEKDFNLRAVADIIKGTKVGHGVRFLPRTIKGLMTRLSELVVEMAKTGLLGVKKELSGVLNELFIRGGISYERYSKIKEENNII